MKTLIISILLLLSVNLFAQNPGRLPYKTVIQYAGGDTVQTKLQGDTVYYSTNKRFFNFNKPLLVNGDTLGSGGSGSTITASDGVYIDVGTVKLGGSSSSGNSTIGFTDNSYYFTFNENWDFPSEIFFNKNSDSNSSINLRAGFSTGSLDVVIDSSGIKYSSLPDTTQTTSTHLMTEVQVKREIAAADKWEVYGNAIKAKNGNVYVSDVAVDEVSDNSMNIESDRIRLYSTEGNDVQLYNGGILVDSSGITTFKTEKNGIIKYKGTYASIYRHRSLGDTTQSIPNGTTPTKITAFSTNGEQSNCTADKTNDKITITKTGRYMVTLSLSYASGTNAVNWTAYIFKAGVECENMHSTGYTATANDKRSTAMSGIINVTSVPCDIDYRVTHSSGSAVDLIFSYVNLNINYIGD